ncbi:hypothetical protein [Erythrobacter sp. Alg231-14]|uniref:hypothetical protein n=1 Tax=Erythrobacter sp. Alg231-14 TaxID=1922225 RepID=UPI00307B61CA
MIEIEVQNETHQTQERMRFSAVPRIGEGIRLREPDGVWASYDVLDVWYQKAEFGDVWMPYLHICITPGEADIVDESVRQHSHVAVEPAVPVAPVPTAPAMHPMATQAPQTHPQPESEPEPIGAYDHEDAAHDLGTESQFASLAGEAEPFKI